MDREANLNKDIRVVIKITNSNDKLAENRKKKAYDMARNVQYIKDELEDSRDKVNCLRVEKRSVELRIRNLDREILDTKVEMKVQICLPSVSH